MLQFRRTIILLRHSSGKKEEKETGSSPSALSNLSAFSPPSPPHALSLISPPLPSTPAAGSIFLLFPSFALPQKSGKYARGKKIFSSHLSLPRFQLSFSSIRSSCFTFLLLSLSLHTHKRWDVGWEVLLLSRIVGGVGERRRGERKML